MTLKRFVLFFVAAAWMLASCGSQATAGLSTTQDTTSNEALSAGQKFYFVNVNSGLVMDVSGASTANAASVIQWANHSGTNQQWTLQPSINGSFEVVNVNSGKCLDVIGMSKAEAAGLQQYECNGSGGQPNQSWWFNQNSDGSWNVVNVNSGLVLDVLGQSKAEGAAIDQWSNWSGANQKWWLQSIQ